MPYIKTRAILSPVFNDDYDIFEIRTIDFPTTPPSTTLAISGLRDIRIYPTILSNSPGLPIIVEEKLADQYKYISGTSTSFFGRLTFNTNRYVRQYADYVVPSVTFSSKYSLEDFNKNLQKIQTQDKAYLGQDRGNGSETILTALESYYYYGWNLSDSLDISNNYIVNYRAAYAGLTQNIPAPTQSLLFTPRPIESDISEINMIPAVIYAGGTLSRYHISEYNSAGQSITYSFLTIPNSSATINTQYLKFRKPSSNVEYVEVWVGPTASTLQLARSNSRTKIYRFNNKCKNINNLETKTIVFQNNYGTFDSYDFTLLNDKIEVTKSYYDSPINLEINRSIPITTDVDPPLGFPLVYTKSRQTYQKQNRIINIKSDIQVTITTRNLNKENLEWMKNLISSENVYEYSNDKLIPIYIQQNSIQIKPINNIYSQLTVNYEYSQKQQVR